MTLKDVRTILIFLLLLSVLSNCTLALFNYTVSIGGSGSIIITYGISVYEQGTTTPCTQINWGTLDRGESVSHGITIVNVGTGDFIGLNMTYIMNPIIGILTWNIEGEPLAVGDSINATLTLNVSMDAQQGSFTCDIYINGET